MINVKKFMKLNKVTLLVILVVLLVFLIPITYSRFENKLNTNAKIDAAFYVVDTKSEVKDIKLGDIVPSDNAYEYNFTVSNFNDKGRSEVNLEYTLIIKTTTNLPLSYELYMNSDENNILISEEIVKDEYGIQADEFLLLDSDEYGTYFNVMKTNKEIFNYKDNKTNSYKLKVKFPKVYDSFDYQDIVEAIFLEVDSKQLIN